MNIFKKKCSYCGTKIKKGEEVFEKVKIPEFTGLKIKPFCSKEHANLYKKCIKGTPSGSSCPYCKT